VRAWRLPSKFNAKPYHAAVPARLSDVAIVHFHGPKPADYLAFASTGACPKFGGMCKVRGEGGDECVRPPAVGRARGLAALELCGEGTCVRGIARDDSGADRW
jgi:hypothetical protein